MLFYSIMIPIKKNKYKKATLTKIPGITGKVKRFDKKLHDNYDVTARQMIKNVLGDLVKDNDDIYGEDMIFTKKDFPYKYLEIQVLSSWEDIFPYLYPFVYARKMRFSKSTLFITFNKYYSDVIIFGRKSISETPSRLKKYDRECIHYIEWRRTMRTTTDLLNEELIKEYAG